MSDNENRPPNRKGVAEVNRQSAIGIGAILIVAALVAAATWARLYWLIPFAGFAMVVGFWRYRKSEGWGNALCFLGVFVAAYGLIALWIDNI